MDASRESVVYKGSKDNIKRIAHEKHSLVVDSAFRRGANQKIGRFDYKEANFW